MKNKIIALVLLIIAYCQTGNAVTIKAASLKFFAGKLDVKETRIKDGAYYKTELRIISKDFKDVLAKPEELWDIELSKLSRTNCSKYKTDQGDTIYERYYHFPIASNYKNRTFELTDEHTLITIAKQAGGFEAIYHTFCFWDIDGDDLILKKIYEIPIGVGIGGVEIEDCIEIEKDRYILILKTSGGDDDASWGSYLFFYIDLQHLDRMKEIHKIVFRSSTEKKTVIKNLHIEMRERKEPHIIYLEEKYNAISPGRLGTEYELETQEEIDLNIWDLLRY
ncbi:MAG: hypothetical protein K9N06_13155 [Candidatus Cloacimonetes bacterium]|nr:hypothetical protein [Candidatus Cloacimonadota bacterium]